MRAATGEGNPLGSPEGCNRSGRQYEGRAPRVVQLRLLQPNQGITDSADGARGAYTGDAGFVEARENNRVLPPRIPCRGRLPRRSENRRGPRKPRQRRVLGRHSNRLLPVLQWRVVKLSKGLAGDRARGDVSARTPRGLTTKPFRLQAKAGPQHEVRAGVLHF